jgi:predicted esterase
MSRMQVEHVQVQRTARVYQLLPVQGPPKQIWLVLHGYGQLAEGFLASFELPVFSEDVVVAPEALSRFYTRGGSGPVGATWMTKEDRTADIADYLLYLRNLCHLLQATYPETPIYLLGFSQGAATAGRLAAALPGVFTRLFLWAGVFPPDLSMDDFSHWPPTLLIRGDEDPILSEEQVRSDLQVLKEKGLPVSRLSFSGGHALEEKVLTQLRKQCG